VVDKNFRCQNDEDLWKEFDRCLEYKEGDVYWKIKVGTRKIGDPAGTIRADGRIQVKLLNKQHKLHRLVFLYYHRYLPERVDHIDGDPQNNAIENLREVTAAENSWNVKAHRDNPTGFHNVSYRGGYLPYRVQYSRGGRCIHNSYPETYEEACEVSKTVGETLGNFQR